MITITQQLFPLDQGVAGDARFCTHNDPPCHRYVLYRWRDESHEWFDEDHHCRSAACIGMNPSGAAGQLDDSTVRLLWRFLTRDGYCRFAMLNSQPYRATDPKDMEVARRNGVDVLDQARNDYWIEREASQAEMVLACWGVIDAERDRALRAVLRPFSDKVYCLGLTQQGFPRHPLRTKVRGIELLRLPC